MPKIYCRSVRWSGVGTIRIFRHRSSSPASSTFCAFVSRFFGGGLVDAASLRVLALAVVTAGENVNDAEEVLAELVVGAGALSSVQNRELGAGLRDDEFQEVEGETRESVAVGDHELS
jgi:hypothetical protein